MSNPFSFFNKIYCINLDERKDRWDRCLVRFEKLGIKDKVERFPAVKFLIEDVRLKKMAGQAGCTMSHFLIVNDAKLKGYKNYLVLEDDFEFYDSAENTLNNLSLSLQDIPEDWDLLYLGGNLTDHYGVFPIENFSKYVFKLNSCHTTHAFSVNSSFYDKFLLNAPNFNNISDWVQKNETIDVFLSKNFHRFSNSFICNPPVLFQERGFSDIESTTVDYKNWIDSTFSHFSNAVKSRDPVSVVFTSCGRFDLLRRTVDSFKKNNTYPINQFIVIENSGNQSCLSILEDIFTNLDAKIVINDENIGQVASIDKAYSFVKSEYIFHCEDDWEFFDRNFIQKSLDVLKCDSYIVNVNVRVRFDGERGSMHPVSEAKKTERGIVYHEYMPNYLGAWHGFSWNPGLRRLSDYNLIGNYKKYGEESRVGQFYYENGKKSACLSKFYCYHIGQNSSTEKRNE
jgi:GR25 family glycosyltransferase involved in LPS biosynthesis